MAIREFSPEEVPRAKIAFVGDMPSGPSLDRFRDRNFKCEATTLDKLCRAQYAAQLDAVIWTQDRHKPYSMIRELRTVVPHLLDHDIRVYVRLAKDERLGGTPRKLVVNALLAGSIPTANLLPYEWQSIANERRERENGYLLPCVYIFDVASTWVDIATVVCDRPAGPSPKFRLNFDDSALLKRFGPFGHTERVMLLRRAFWDCSELQLELLEGGMSGASVFKAYASLGAGLVQQGRGAYPHLFFVKIGPRKKIVDEFDKYFWHMAEYVPFHLEPRLRRERCNLGSTQGALVGDFVDGAESLVTSARGGRCVHAVANLFDKTLAGWRKQAVPDTLRLLDSYLEDKWRVEGSTRAIALPISRAKLVRHLGGNTRVGPLKKIFEDRAKSAPFVAPAHGDMHATNVLVRHGDAILIDFEKLVASYPLTYDPASLEGGLLVEGFVRNLRKGEIRLRELVRLLNPLYEEPALSGRQMAICRRGEVVEWYYDAVNQIRALSWSAENEPGQYALTLALCLIRKGCNPDEALEADGHNMSRAMAFFFGQKILLAASSTIRATGRRRARSSKRGARG